MDNDSLVDAIEEEFYLRFKALGDSRVFDAMREVDRINFIGDKEIYSVGREIDGRYLVTKMEAAYNDVVVCFGKGLTTSEPSLIAFMLNSLDLQEGMSVLEIGTGLGYQAAIISHLIGNKGYLVTMEIKRRSAKKVRVNFRNHFGDEFEERLMVVRGDGSIGFEKKAPYDRIVIAAEVSENFDSSIIRKQLEPKGGILIYPNWQNILVLEGYKNGNFEGKQELLGGVSFIPLRGLNS